MAVSCGNDIVKVSRIKNSIEKIGDTFIKRIYTDEEINYCESRRMCKYQSYAVRFAAKEAVYKALSPLNDEDATWKDIEIKREENGKPKVYLKGFLGDYAKSIGINENQIDISLSHDDDFAIATVVIEY